MAKATSYTKVQNIRMTIRLNQRNAANTGFVPVKITTDMQALTADGGVRDVQKIVEVGAVKTTEYTPAELAGIVKGSNNSTGDYLLAELTKAYTDSIGGIA